MRTKNAAPKDEKRSIFPTEAEIDFFSLRLKKKHALHNVHDESFFEGFVEMLDLSEPEKRKRIAK